MDSQRRSNDPIARARPKSIHRIIPIKKFLEPLKAEFNAHHSLPIILTCACLFRLILGLGSFSGQGVNPMHGDFEAQRHWLEITQNLPLNQWYFYDLQYWGLDYPPLTAYHSWILGKIGSCFNHQWFTLDNSRGNEAYGLVVFMRLSVIASELLTYIPAIILFATFFTSSVVDRTTNALLLLLQPSLLLIDHGHFQYNSVMLGLFVYSLYFLVKGRLYLGAAFFVFCLAFKQMGLYYAPAIFAFLLSKTIRDPQKFLYLSITTAMCFTFCFGPFYIVDGFTGLSQVFIRMFPFGRGLFEDKVANFWCMVNVLYKLKSNVDAVSLQRLSLLLTLLSVMPGSIALYVKPTARNLVLGTASSAWGFYLFSFQVHEKSVLLPLMPSSLLLLGPHEFRAWVGYINIVSAFSMWPLLKKDGLQLQYFVYTAFWIWLGGFWHSSAEHRRPGNFCKVLFSLTYIGILTMHLAEPFLAIQGKPDLWPVLNVMLCAPAFGVFYLWTIYHMVYGQASI